MSAVIPLEMPSAIALPDTELVTRNRIEQLESMTTANGYSRDWTARRLTRRPSEPDDGFLYLTAEGPYRKDLEGDAPQNQLAAGFSQGPGRPWQGVERLILPYRIEAFRRLGVDDTRAVDEALAEASAWVQLCWLVDPCCGGLARNSWFTSEERLVTEDPPGVAIRFEVEIERPIGRPLREPA